MATTCFCPTEGVNWDKPGGICQWNFPCGSRDVLPFYNWYVDDTKDTDVIIIPDKAVLMPCWIFAMPCFWLHACIMTPLLEANIFKIYEKNGNLRLDYLRKNAFSESIKYSRKKLISASLDEEKAGVFTPRKLRISLLCGNGMAPDKGAWLNMNSQFDESILQRCVDLINSKIADLNERNDNSLTLIEPSAPMLANVAVISDPVTPRNEDNEKRRKFVNSNNRENSLSSSSRRSRPSQNMDDGDENLDIPVATAIVVNQSMESRNTKTIY